MSGGGYIPPPGGYPSGPDTCGNRTDCEPLVSSFTEPIGLLAPLYSFAGLVAVALLVLPLKNALNARRLRAKGGGNSAGGLHDRLLPGGTAGSGGAGGVVELDGGVRVAGFVDSTVGQACYCLV
eukprot:COSAG06_NODE_28251_length_577_cov_10.778243_1_plen_123_part_01